MAIHQTTNLGVVGSNPARCATINQINDLQDGLEQFGTSAPFSVPRMFSFRLLCRVG